MKEKFKNIEIKAVFFYIFLFVIFLVWNLLLVPVNLDEVWNYGFSHNIYNGLIPYKDFNMVITPLYPMLMSIFFYIFGSNMLVFHIENAILLVILSYFLFKLFKERAWLVILFLFIPLPVSFPSYNLFLFFLLVLTIYCEKTKKNDYMVGFLLACICLTKQSVGVCVLFVSLYYIKNLKKIGKRVVGFLVPCLIFLVYLLVTRSFMNFLDLCLFGLFDFAEGNGKSFNIYWILFIGVTLVTLYFIKKDNKNITYYYVLAFYSILIPLFDTYHFQVMFLSFLLIVMDKIKLPEKLNVKLLVFGIIIGISCVTFIKRFDGRIIYPNDIRHFEYRLLDIDSIEFTKEVNAFIKENKDRNFVFLCSNGYYFRIVNDMKIDYLDLINTGNWGYDGSNKLFESVMDVEDAIYIVDESELSEIKQTDKKVLKYVLKKGKKIKSIRIYDIYEIE